MKFKKIAITTLLTLSVSCFSMMPAAAANESTGTTGYIWDQSTGQITSYDPSEFQNVVNVPIKPDKLVKSKNKNNSGISPMLLYMYIFDHYSESSESLYWQAHYVGVTRIDNSGSMSPTTLIFTASSSGEWSVSGTTGMEVEVELDAIVATVKATSQVSATATRSWISGFQYGAQTIIPAYTIGKVTAYIPGTTSNGYAVYKVKNTSNDDWWWQYRDRGAMVPAQNAWNFVVQIPCS